MTVTAITAGAARSATRGSGSRRVGRPRAADVHDEPATAGTVHVTIDLSGVPDRERVLRALRELVAAGGAGPDDPGHDPAATAAAGLAIRPGVRAVERRGEPVRLSRLEYDLLVFFARHPHRVFTRQQLLTHVWGHTFAGSRTVDVHIRRLRAKLAADGPLVTTVHGVGYRLADGAPVRLVDG
jgi:hypothetical protein